MATTAESASITTLTNWLKDQYYGPGEDMVKTFNTSSYFFDEDLFGRQLAKTADGGNQFVYPLQTGRYTGFGGRGDGSQLAVARDADRQRLYGTLVNHYIRGRFTGPGARRSRNQSYSYYESVQHLVKEMPNDFGKYMAQACWRDGTGIIARLNCEPTGSDFGNTQAAIVDVNHSVGDGAANSGYTFGTDHMHAGMVIDFWNGGTAKADLADAQNRDQPNDVTAINSTTTFTTSTDIHADVADDDWISWSVNTGETPTELTGISAHVNTTGTVHNVAKTNSWFQPAFVTGTEGDDTTFTLDNCQTDIRSIVHTVGPNRMKRLVMITTPPLWDISANEMKELTRFDADDFDMKWGWATISFVRGGVRCTMVEDDDCPGGSIFYLTPEAFKFHQSGDPHFIDDDGLTIRNVQDYDVWETIWHWDVELVCVNPRFTGWRRGLAET